MRVQGIAGAIPGRQTLSRRQVGLALAALLAVTALAYSGTLFAGFVWDEADWVIPPATRAPAEVLWEGLWRTEAGGGWALNYYRPLGALTFALDGWLWGLRPIGFHLTNLLLYLGCIALAFPLAKKLLGSVEGALVAAAVFALHPVHVETVALVHYRLHVMAFAGVTATLLAFIKALEQRPSWPLLGGMGVAFLAATLFTEAALVAPGLAVACWAFGHGGQRAPVGRVARALAPLLLGLGLYAALRAAAVAPAATAPDRLDPQGRWMLAPVLFAKYVGLLFWPHPLTAYYDIPIPATAGDPRRLIGIAVVFAILATTVWTMRRGPRMALALIWFVIGIAPVLHIVPLKGFIMAERYLLLPSFGFALAAGLLGETLWKRVAGRAARLALAACGAMVAIAWVAIIMARVPDWVEKVGFYRAMVRTTPSSAFAHANLGQVLVNEGEVEEGIRHLERAVFLQPDMADAQVRLGLAYWRHGELPRAIGPLETAARLRPQDPRLQRALAIALGEEGRTRDAVAVLHRLEALQPGSAEVARRLAAAYAALGDRPRADRYAARADLLAASPRGGGGSAR